MNQGSVVFRDSHLGRDASDIRDDAKLGAFGHELADAFLDPRCHNHPGDRCAEIRVGETGLFQRDLRLHLIEPGLGFE